MLFLYSLPSSFSASLSISPLNHLASASISSLPLSFLSSSLAHCPVLSPEM